MPLGAKSYGATRINKKGLLRDMVNGGGEGRVTEKKEEKGGGKEENKVNSINYPP